MAILLSRGSRGELVKKLQRALNLIDDGIFGSITEEAVKDFQRANGLVPDGIVGEKTWAKLPIEKGLFSLKKSKRTIKEIIVHCTATVEGKNYTVDDIRRWHKVPKEQGGLGASDIGYHYVIDINGRIFEGRNVNLVGAHCVEHNTYSIGVVYIGGLDARKQPKDTRNEKQKAALLSLLKDLKRMYPAAKIYGHRDFDKHGKACPCFDAKNEYRNI